MTTEDRKIAPILVTGAHRTGTTWVGKMLAANPHTAYISEPLNVLHRRGVMEAPVEHWYTYISEENEGDFLPGLKKTLALRYGLFAEIPTLRSWHDFQRMGRDAYIFGRGRLTNARPLLKDPFAVFSLAWFAEQLGCQVVVTLRHPAAFASSLKRLGWTFDFGDLLAQPLLMSDWLEPYRSDMEAALARPEDVIGQAGLLWKMIYASVAKLQQAPGSAAWLRLVKHDDLSLDPPGGYRALYEWLSLPYTERIEQAILASSSAENPGELSRKKVHSVRLDSRANLHNWKKRLTPAEILSIRRLTEETATLFYADIPWE
jgi:hypothetical protein